MKNDEKKKNEPMFKCWMIPEAGHLTYEMDGEIPKGGEGGRTMRK